LDIYTRGATRGDQDARGRADAFAQGPAERGEAVQGRAEQDGGRGAGRDAGAGVPGAPGGDDRTDRASGAVLRADGPGGAGGALRRRGRADGGGEGGDREGRGGPGVRRGAVRGGAEDGALRDRVVRGRGGVRP